MCALSLFPRVWCGKLIINFWRYERTKHTDHETPSGPTSLGPWCACEINLNQRARERTHARTHERTNETHIFGNHLRTREAQAILFSSRVCLFCVPIAIPASCCWFLRISLSQWGPTTDRQEREVAHAQNEETDGRSSTEGRAPCQG